MQLHAIIAGRVQGVFFRVRTCDFAIQRNLSGWVKNLHDGTVEVLAEGLKSNLQILLEWLRHGPKYAQVSKVEYKFIDQSEDLLPFRIIY
jgi:acylphosphatase